MIKLEFPGEIRILKNLYPLPWVWLAPIIEIILMNIVVIHIFKCYIIKYVNIWKIYIIQWTNIFWMANAWCYILCIDKGSFRNASSVNGFLYNKYRKFSDSVSNSIPELLKILTCKILMQYQRIHKIDWKTIQPLLPFLITYLCEYLFSF